MNKKLKAIMRIKYLAIKIEKKYELSYSYYKSLGILISRFVIGYDAQG